MQVLCPQVCMPSAAWRLDPAYALCMARILCHAVRGNSAHVQRPGVCLPAVARTLPPGHALHAICPCHAGRGSSAHGLCPCVGMPASAKGRLCIAGVPVICVVCPTKHGSLMAQALALPRPLASEALDRGASLLCHSLPHHPGVSFGVPRTGHFGYGHPEVAQAWLRLPAGRGWSQRRCMHWPRLASGCCGPDRQRLGRSIYQCAADTCRINQHKQLQRVWHNFTNIFLIAHT